MNKLRIIVLCTAMVALLIGSNYSCAQSDPAGTDKFQKKFNKKDTDGDGKISYKEYMEYSNKRAEDKFKRMDLNEDGFISNDEYKKAKAEKRKGKQK